MSKENAPLLVATVVGLPPCRFDAMAIIVGSHGTDVNVGVLAPRAAGCRVAAQARNAMPAALQRWRGVAGVAPTAVRRRQRHASALFTNVAHRLQLQTAWSNFFSFYTTLNNNYKQNLDPSWRVISVPAYSE